MSFQEVLAPKFRFKIEDLSIKFLKWAILSCFGFVVSDVFAFMDLLAIELMSY